MTQKFIIITGGPGTGKTTLVQALKKRSYFCVEEAARRLIQEEIATGGTRLPWKDIQLSIDEMMRRTIQSYHFAMSYPGPIFFDRGILDYISFARRTKTYVDPLLMKEALSLTYQQKVLVTPPWETIFCQDSERKQTFPESIDIHNKLVTIYKEHSYQLIDLPKIGVEARIDWLLEHFLTERF